MSSYESDMVKTRSQSLSEEPVTPVDTPLASGMVNALEETPTPVVGPQPPTSEPVLREAVASAEATHMEGTTIPPAPIQGHLPNPVEIPMAQFTRMFEAISAQLTAMSQQTNEKLTKLAEKCDQTNQKLDDYMRENSVKMAILQENIDSVETNLQAKISEQQTEVKNKFWEVRKEFDVAIEKRASTIISSVTNTCTEQVTAVEKSLQAEVNIVKQQFDTKLSELVPTHTSICDGMNRLEERVIALEARQQRTVDTLGPIATSQVSTGQPLHPPNSGICLSPLGGVHQSGPSTNPAPTGTILSNSPPTTVPSTAQSADSPSLSLHTPELGQSHHDALAFLKVRRFQVYRQDHSKIHPLDWINQFRTSLPPGWTEAQKMQFMCGLIEGDAASHMLGISESCNTVDEFRERFLASYWSASTQERLMGKLADMPPLWLSNFNSPFEYVQQFVRQNRYFTPPMSELEVIRLCMSKFPNDLRQTMKAAHAVSKLQDFLDFLEILGTDYTIRRSKSPPNNSGSSTSNQMMPTSGQSFRSSQNVNRNHIPPYHHSQPPFNDRNRYQNNNYNRNRDRNHGNLQRNNNNDNNNNSNRAVEIRPANPARTESTSHTN